MHSQAEQQLGPDWTLQKADTPGVLDLPTWLAKNMPAGARVGVDPLLHTIDGARKLQVGWSFVGHAFCCCSAAGALVCSAGSQHAGAGRQIALRGAIATCVLSSQKALEGAGHELVPVSGGNLVDAIWSDRPQAPTVCGCCACCH